jgi:hypothetical protein
MWEVKTDVVEKHTAYIFTAEVTLKMESVWSLETLESTYKYTRCYYKKNSTDNQNCLLGCTAV